MVVKILELNESESEEVTIRQYQNRRGHTLFVLETIVGNFYIRNNNRGGRTPDKSRKQVLSKQYQNSQVLTQSEPDSARAFPRLKYQWASQLSLWGDTLASVTQPFFICFLSKFLHPQEFLALLWDLE